MKARISDNLLKDIEREMPNEGHRHDAKFLALRDRIQGQTVDLTFIGQDAFEEHDDNYWLPASCWTQQP
jgi:hypothetical protein